MSQFAERPHPAAVPTLTEVIELLNPIPVDDASMHAAPKLAPPEAGSAAGAPMSTVAVPTLSEVAIPPAAIEPSVEPPVLKTMVPQPPPSVAQASKPLVPVASMAPVQQPAMPDISETQLTQRVLGLVQKQVDSMIEFRLKEAMAPILARHTDALVRELREELARTMGDVIARSVSQEMAKLRQR